MHGWNETSYHVVKIPLSGRNGANENCLKFISWFVGYGRYVQVHDVITLISVSNV